MINIKKDAAVYLDYLKNMIDDFADIKQKEDNNNIIIKKIDNLYDNLEVRNIEWLNDEDIGVYIFLSSENVRYVGLAGIGQNHTLKKRLNIQLSCYKSNGTVAKKLLRSLNIDIEMSGTQYRRKRIVENFSDLIVIKTGNITDEIDKGKTLILETLLIATLKPDLNF